MVVFMAKQTVQVQQTYPPEFYDGHLYWHGRETAQEAVEQMKGLPEITKNRAFDLARGFLHKVDLINYIPDNLKAEVIEPYLLTAVHVNILAERDVDPSKLGKELVPVMVLSSLTKFELGVWRSYQAIYQVLGDPSLAGRPDFSKTDWQTDRDGLGDFEKMLVVSF